MSENIFTSFLPRENLYYFCYQFHLCHPLKLRDPIGKPEGWDHSLSINTDQKHVYELI